MPLPTGARVGPYEILAALGAGGMGEVYKARDSKLERIVALKTLPALFAADPDRVARFEREARLLASLNHPNIAHVYDAGQDAVAVGGTAGGRIAFLTMELVDGEDLAARIARGAITLEDALPIARQIAAALDSAHAKGIVHRDLKPANVKIAADGTVKVLDFGLAKAMSGAADESGVSAYDGNSPTLNAPATQMGLILGTAAYMAPEQARGKAVDKRADIWAFGCVLFEMLTARRPFAGDDLTEILASVVKDEPDFHAVPRAVRRLLRRCLEKDPKKRLRDIGDAWDLLEDHTAHAAPVAPARRNLLAWSAATMALLLLGIPAVTHLREVPSAPTTLAFQVPWPAGESGQVRGERFFALSPDGRHVAIVDGGTLWARSLDAVEPVRLEHTDGATYPFWSPDGASIAFFADGQLKRIARAGGPVQIITTVSEPRGGAWSGNGTILYSDALGRSGLKSVPDVGGASTVITKLNATLTSDGHRYPQFLPDGEHFLYLHLAGTEAVAGVYLGSLKGGAPVKVLDGQDSALYTGTPGHGYLVFRRNDTVMAQPFDSAGAKSTGSMFPLIEGIGQGANTGLGAISVSDSGDILTWAGGLAAAELTWYDRAGRRGAAAAPPAEIAGLGLSRDAARLASAITSGGTTDIWTTHLPGGTPSKFTFGPGPGWSEPTLSPDGQEIAYATADNAGLATYELRRKRFDMGGSEETLATSRTIMWLWDWSPDGSYLLFNSDNALWQLPLAVHDGKRTPTKLTTGPDDEQYGQVSPDGRWLAYAGGQRATMQVFVQPMPPTGAMWLVSKDGGTMPRWRADGKELFYRAADGRLMAVPITTGAGSIFQNGTPQPLFGPLPIAGTLNRFTYVPTADGRFLVTVPVESAATPMTMLLNRLR